MEPGKVKRLVSHHSPKELAVGMDEPSPLAGGWESRHHESGRAPRAR